MDSKKKRKAIYSKKKTNKKVKSNIKDAHNENLETEDSEIEILDSKILREGLLILGCVTRIDKYRITLSLPGCFFATVEANNISSEFSEEVTNLTDEFYSKEPSIESILQVGMVYPCKLIKIEHLSHRRMNIFASLKPEDINASLKPSSLYRKMVLYVSICSVEDHGYSVNVGNDQIKAFLPKQHFENESLKVGQIIPTVIHRVHPEEQSAIVQLMKLDFNEEFPKVTATDIHLHSILPGAKISADVIEVTDHFLRLKYCDFDVCASMFSSSSNTNLEIGSSVEGTVLFVNPVSHMIHMTVKSIPSPNLFPKFFQLKKFDYVKNPKFLYFFRSRAFYKISKNSYGFINVKDLPYVEESEAATSLHHTKIEKARVTNCHYIDNLIQLSAKPSIMEETIVFPEDVQVGDVYDVTIQKHVENGMFVKISIGCSGFIRRLHMSDIYLTKPEVLHPVGSKARCRVLSTDGHGKITLTAKKTLLDLEEHLILSSFYSVHIGRCYKGVIVKKSSTYIIVLFFNNVQGIVNDANIPESAVFFEGQTVLCEVLSCIPAKKLLRLSLKTLNRNFSDKKVVSSADYKLQQVKYLKDGNKAQNVVSSEDSCDDDASLDVSKNISNNINNQKLETAIIKKVKGDQLNITLKKIKGRVHITNLGCKSEGLYPLKKFSAKQKIQVYAFGECKKKRRNFLEISHRNLTTFKDCALSFPPASIIHGLKPGNTVIGFVKDVHDVSVTIWLSPTTTGILEYLHFSENPKVVRKLSNHLKVGLSLEVKIWQVLSSDVKREKHSFILTRKDFEKPEIGRNILGLVQITCLESGLFLKLPFGYHGAVCVTDLSDVYSLVSTQLQKYLKLKFVLCHILEVNHETKYCQLSLRKSRLFKKVAEGKNLSPEIDPNTIKEGQSIRGYVKTVTDSTITVIIGRKLEGKVQLHSCTLAECQECSLSKSSLKKYSAGTVIDVIVQRILDHKNFTFTLEEQKNKENLKCNRLLVDKDVFWEEMNS